MAIGKQKRSPLKGLPSKKISSRGLSAQADARAEGKSAEKVRTAKVENFADDTDIQKAAANLGEKIQTCYDNKQEQVDNCEEYWNIYNAKPDENQQYAGNNQCYIPAVRDALAARTKRILAQLFPVNHKHVDVTGPTPDTPYAQLALTEHYIRQTQLKRVIREMLIAGDVTGQWSLYVDWTKSYRTIKEVIRRPPILEDTELGVEVGRMPEALTDDEDFDEELEEKEIITEGPDVCVVAVEDVAVYPPTVSRSRDAIATSVKLRLSWDAIKRMMEEGVFVEKEGEDIDDLMANFSNPDGGREKRVPPKQRTHDAGIRTEGTYKYLLVYEICADLKLDGKRKESCLIYYAGRGRVLGVIRNPRWNGHAPLLSAPIEPLAGSFFGISKIESVKYLQWNLNDFWNMGMDSAQYALLPIVMTDPLKQPNYQSMVMGLAAVWLADPNSTQFQTFPQIWKDAVMLCSGIKSQIWESLDVNDAMMGKTSPGRKNNLAIGQQQQEQQTNIQDHAKNCEELILNPLMEEFADLDRQYRTESLTIETMGDVGTRAKVMQIEPQQFGITYFYRWAGTAFQMNMQRLQQMIAWVNVLRGMDPGMLNGRKLDITPLLEFGTEQMFGPEVAPRILVDERNLFVIDPETENIMMHNAIMAPIHQMDDDVLHLQSHNAAAVQTGDPNGMIRTHIAQHVAQLQAKQSQAQPGGPMGAPGVPGGQQPPGGPAPGVAGTPRIGAQPSVPRPQGPPGMINADAMPGVPGRG